MGTHNGLPRRAWEPDGGNEFIAHDLEVNAGMTARVVITPLCAEVLSRLHNYLKSFLTGGQMKDGFWQSRGVKKDALSVPKGLLAFVCVLSALLPVLSPTCATADDLGEHILASILRDERPSDAALLLLTRDLKWYEQNMGRLKPFRGVEDIFPRSGG